MGKTMWKTCSSTKIETQASRPKSKEVLLTPTARYHHEAHIVIKWDLLRTDAKNGYSHVQHMEVFSNRAVTAVVTCGKSYRDIDEVWMLLQPLKLYHICRWPALK